MCYDLVDQGQKPACVQSCPYRAMDFGPLDELQAAHGTFNAPAPLPDPSITKPSIVYSPNNVTKLTGDKSGSVKNLEEV
jgi:anaerobic dimethyl sulfoxide reductase subunit B (iron-sulfur subunit)